MKPSATRPPAEAARRPLAEGASAAPPQQPPAEGAQRPLAEGAATTQPQQPLVFTIGHSVHPFAGFADLLAMHRIDALADVRFVPYSRVAAHFAMQQQYDRERLIEQLRPSGVAYAYLGDGLGGRSNDPAAYAVDDRVSYDWLASTAAFATDLARLADGASRMRVCLMCGEREPLDCHRSVLLAPRLVAQGFTVLHIDGDGSLEPHTELPAGWRHSFADDGAGGSDIAVTTTTTEQRLVEMYFKPSQRAAQQPSLLADAGDAAAEHQRLLDAAYRRREHRIAHRKPAEMGG